MAHGSSTPATRVDASESQGDEKQAIERPCGGERDSVPAPTKILPHSSSLPLFRGSCPPQSDRSAVAHHHLRAFPSSSRPGPSALRPCIHMTTSHHTSSHSSFFRFAFSMPFNSWRPHALTIWHCSSSPAQRVRLVLWQAGIRCSASGEP
ncbi:hypothetical protein PCASD_12278 [Puccinia coronata f. sp. avenae]|uniref:Uncharacterized protein n=1 Tax=Puccinia coronata f. sp. avenae TaxID=200324 RepID=A0A2N5UR05_9BASI|nr:hypothetical protein PCASD_25116 [Puccinia coronata f. sp. avenae]PLW40182.1 hypothetical protein PCASD_12278 [Puccinia coronata f. sp. avenae]